MKTASIVALLVLYASVCLSEAGCGYCRHGSKCVHGKCVKVTASAGGYASAQSKHGKAHAWKHDEVNIHKGSAQAKTKQEGGAHGYNNQVDVGGSAKVHRKTKGGKSGAVAVGGGSAGNDGFGASSVKSKQNAYVNKHGSGASSNVHGSAHGRNANTAVSGYVKATHG